MVLIIIVYLLSATWRSIPVSWESEFWEISCLLNYVRVSSIPDYSYYPIIFHICIVVHGLRFSSKLAFSVFFPFLFAKGNFASSHDNMLIIRTNTLAIYIIYMCVCAFERTLDCVFVLLRITSQLLICACF